MMRTLFLLLSFLSDSQTITEIVGHSFVLGTVSAAVLIFLGTWHAARRLVRGRA